MAFRLCSIAFVFFLAVAGPAAAPAEAAEEQGATFSFTLGTSSMEEPKTWRH